MEQIDEELAEVKLSMIQLEEVAVNTQDIQTKSFNDWYEHWIEYWKGIEEFYHPATCLPSRGIRWNKIAIKWNKIVIKRNKRKLDKYKNEESIK